MAGLQRSVVSFRRQGSSGFVWDDKLITEELNKPPPKDQEAQSSEVKAPTSIPPIKTVGRSRSNGGGGRGYRAKDMPAPAIEPPSPRVSACGFCSAFAKSSNKNRVAKSGKRKSR